MDRQKWHSHRHNFGCEAQPGRALHENDFRINVKVRVAVLYRMFFRNLSSLFTVTQRCTYVYKLQRSMSDTAKVMGCDKCLLYVNAIIKPGIIHVRVEFLCRRKTRNVNNVMR